MVKKLHNFKLYSAISFIKRLQNKIEKKEFPGALCYSEWIEFSLRKLPLNDKKSH